MGRLRSNRIINADCLDEEVGLPSLPNECAGLITTDPPYGREYLPLYKGVIRHAGRLLMSGASLLMIAPHYVLPAISDFPSPNLSFRWTLAMFQRDDNWARLVNAKKTIAVTWKPLLWWTKEPWGTTDYSMVEDSFVSPGREKDLHKWQQNTAWAEYCLEFAVDNELVIDPFIGSGTTAIACRKHNYPWLGYEIDEQEAKKAERNIANYQDRLFDEARQQ